MMNYIPTTMQAVKSNWRLKVGFLVGLIITVSLGYFASTADSISQSNNDNQAAAFQPTTTPVGTTTNDRSGSSTQGDTSTSTNSTTTVQTEEDTDSSTQSREVTFSTIRLEAEAAVVWDAAHNEAIFAKRPDKERPLASLTKLMTALVATNQNADENDPQAVISEQHLDALGDQGLRIGETWKLSDLISFMLIESSNDAARAVAAAGSENPKDGYADKFVEAMNDKASSLDLESTYFFNPSGLDLNETLISGGYGTARDVAKLLDHITETDRSIMEATTRKTSQFTSLEGASYTAHNTNSWIDRFPNVSGSKTGYTTLAGGNLAVSLTINDRPVVISVLGSSKQGRFEDVHDLYQATQTYLTEKDNENTN